MKSFLRIWIFFVFLVSLSIPVRAQPKWHLIGQFRPQFDVHHPQGLVKIKDRFFLSTVDVKDKKKQQGVGYLIEFDRDGRRKREVKLGDGAIYHPGGIDYDGTWIWMPVAEYRPRSQTIIYKVNPKTMKVIEAFRVNDHIGAVVYNRELKTVVGMNWNSEAFYEWTPKGKLIRKVVNEFSRVNFQDCQYLSGPSMICAGVKDNARGALVLVDLFDFENQKVLKLVPRTKKNILMTRNPMAIETHGDNYRYYFLPEDNFAIVYIYEIY